MPITTAIDNTQTAHLNVLNSTVSFPTFSLRERNVFITSESAIPSLSVINSISSGPKSNLS